MSGLFLSYLPRKKEMIVPSAPTKIKPNISNPTGIRLGGGVSSTKVGIAIGGAGVNVESCVATEDGIKIAASVGLIVGVEAGVGVGGESTNGKSLVALVKETYKAYTQPIEPGTPS